MGNNISSICSCNESNTNEHSFVSLIMIIFHKQNESNNGTNKTRANQFDKTHRKSRAIKSSSAISDIETSDYLMENSRMDLALTIKMNEEVVYEGPLLNDKKNGNGIIKTKNNTLIYEGEFKDDLYDGEGLLFLDQSLIYSGSFKNGKKNGKGLLFSNENKYRYDGEWKDDLKNGEGTETNPDGSSFVGQFLNNKKNGKGKEF